MIESMEAEEHQNYSQIISSFNECSILIPGRTVYEKVQKKTSKLGNLFDMITRKKEEYRVSKTPVRVLLIQGKGYVSIFCDDLHSTFFHQMQMLSGNYNLIDNNHRRYMFLCWLIDICKRVMPEEVSLLQV